MRTVAFTGMTNTARNQGKIGTLGSTLVDCAKRLGYQIVDPDADADVVFAVIYSPCSFASVYAPRTLYSIGRAVQNGKIVIPYLDDWNLKASKNVFNTQKYTRQRAVQLHHKNPELLDVHERVTAQIYLATAKYLAPRFNTGGDLQKFWDQQIICVDPSNFAPLYSTVRVPKNPWWVLGSLREYKVVSEWPIRRFGNWKAHQRITESELHIEYCAAYGVLSPTYYHAGSGWWRMRYTMSARAGTVLCGTKRSLDDTMFGGSGGPYDFGIADIEAMTDSKLQDIAAEQARVFWECTTPAKQYIDTIRGIMEVGL